MKNFAKHYHANQSTPDVEGRSEQLVCDGCGGVGVRYIEDTIDDCWFCNGTGEAN